MAQPEREMETQQLFTTLQFDYCYLFKNQIKYRLLVLI